ncbi:MAG: IS4 family transposase [Petrotogales bacterium]
MVNKKNVKKTKSNPVIEAELNKLFSPEWLRKIAKETGLIKRERKIDPVLIFWVLVLGFGVQLQRTLASLHREYEERGSIDLSRSSFYERFSPELVRFLHVCVVHGIENLAESYHHVLKEKLSVFKDLLIQDSTIIRVHEKLAKKWPAVRTRKAAADVKVSVLVSAVSDGVKRVMIYGERMSEIKTLRIGPWIKDRILLLDLGFYKHQVFTRVKENGGFFVSRLKGNADPLVVQTYSVCRGRSINVTGKHVSEILLKLKRKILDVEVEISFRRRKYNGKTRGDIERFRLVAVYNKEEQKYHTYLTNISAEILDAEEIAQLYGARWHVELIFKELKSRYGIDILPTSNPEIVKALLWVGILTLLVSRKVYWIVCSNNLDKAVRYTHLRWATIFAEKSSRLMDWVLDYAGLNPDLIEHYNVYESQALDPNVNRKRLTDVWRA